MAQYKSQKQKNPQEKEFRSIPTNDKNGELAVFYNIAYNRIDHLLMNLNHDQTEIRSRFKHMNPIDFLECNIDNDLFPDNKIIYQWLAHLFLKRSMKEYTKEEIEHLRPILNLIILKLWRIRDFQSHYYHTEDGLIFTEYYARKLNRFFVDAEKAVYPNYLASAIGEYHKQHEKHSSRISDTFYTPYFEKADGKIFITNEGKNIFLSFFLSNSEMNQFLNMREGCSKAFPMSFKIKRDIYKFYCHRDQAHVFKIALPKSEAVESSQKILDEEQYVWAILASYENYLRAVPDFIYDKLDSDRRMNQFRKKNQFTEHALNYLSLANVMDGYHWKTNDTYTVTKPMVNSTETGEYHTEYEKKIYIFKSQKNQTDRWVINEGEIYFRKLIDESNNRWIQAKVGKQWMMCLITALYFDKDVLPSLNLFLQAKCNLLSAVVEEKEVAIKDEKICKKYYGENFERHPRLQKLMGLSNMIDESTYKDQVQNAIRRKIKYFEHNYKDLKDRPTIIGEHQITIDKGDSKRITDEQLETLEKSRNEISAAKKIRYRKNRLIKSAFKYFDKNRMNLTVNQNNSIDKFHYLFDLIGGKELKRQRYERIIEYFDHKIPSIVIRKIYPKAKSFDHLFNLSMDYGMLHLKDIDKNFEAQSIEQIHALAAQFNISWYKSNENRFASQERKRKEILSELFFHEEEDRGTTKQIFSFDFSTVILKQLLGERISLKEEHIAELVKSDAPYTVHMPQFEKLYDAFGHYYDLHKQNDDNTEIVENLNEVNSLKKWRKEDALISFVKTKYLTFITSKYTDTANKEIVSCATHSGFNLIWRPSLKIDGKINYLGIGIYMTERQLFSNSFLMFKDRFIKIIQNKMNSDLNSPKYLWEKGNNYMYSDLLKEMSGVMRDAVILVSTILKIEKALDKRFDYKCALNHKDAYIKFDQIIEEIKSKYGFVDPKLSIWRNNALHADVPVSFSYYKVKTELENDIKGEN